MKDNVDEIANSYDTVVNCFQKLLSSWWRTTLKVCKPLTRRLWIAFKNYYLRDEGQPQKNNLLVFSRLFLFLGCKIQNNSSCWKVGGGSSLFLAKKISMSPNCLSVMHIMATFPAFGSINFTLLIWTSAFSRLGQWRTYIENWNKVNPSSIKAFRKRFASFIFAFVSVGRSYNTKTHIIRYALNLSAFIFGDYCLFVITFAARPEWNPSTPLRINYRRIKLP